MSLSYCRQNTMELSVLSAEKVYVCICKRYIYVVCRYA